MTTKQVTLIAAVTSLVTVVLVAVLLWVAGVAAGPLASNGGSVPRLINYQGRLTDAAGNPLTGSYNMTFALYDAATGGTSLWCETQAVTVTYGVFNALLGSVNSIPTSAFNGQNLYLGVRVGSDSEMTPRRRVVSAGYAYRAEEAVDADTLDGSHASAFEQVGTVSTHATDPNAHHTRYTDAEAVAAIKAADGVGSGLDADTVDGIHASVNPEANKLVALDANAKLPVSVVPFKVYDSGWFPVGPNSIYAITHNLGTTKVAYWLFFSTSADGSNPMTNNTTSHYDTLKEAGLQLTFITATTCYLATGGNAPMIQFTTSGRVYHSTGYARVLMMALE